MTPDPAMAGTRLPGRPVAYECPDSHARYASLKIEGLCGVHVGVCANAAHPQRKAGMKRLGIIICDRYHTCAGGKCLRAMRNREGAFAIYEGEELELVGFTTCGGCPGGNVEYAPAEMKKNGAEVVHLATGLVVGYPPCPSIDAFSEFLPAKYGLDVVMGTHPIPEGYYRTHQALGTWDSADWKRRIAHVLTDEETRLSYD